MTDCKHQARCTVDGQVTQIFCRIARGNRVDSTVRDEVSPSICAACPLRNTDSIKLSPVSKLNNPNQSNTYTSPQDFKTAPANWKSRKPRRSEPRKEEFEDIVFTPAAVSRPDLQAIEFTLPPHEEGRDRKFIIEDDGTIVYERGTDWEPPRPIKGYRQDKSDPWRFVPIWPLCKTRQAMGVRYPNCGCIGIVMRCDCPSHPKYQDRVEPSDCLNCEHRPT